MIIEEIIFVVLFFQYFILGVNEASSKEYNIQEMKIDSKRNKESPMK